MAHLSATIIRIACLLFALQQIAAVPITERNTIQQRRDKTTDYNHVKYNKTLPAGYELDIDLKNIDRCDGDFCDGTVNSGDPSYVCGDSRLGPVILPACLPLKSLITGTTAYRRFGGQCPGEFLSKWATYAPPGKVGWFSYPFADGFANNTAGTPIRGRLTLEPGVLVDRFGGTGGSFVAPAGSPYNQRALPPANLNLNTGNSSATWNYHVYEVKKPLTAVGGPVTPWFGQPGYGTQFQLSSSLASLLSNGVLEEVEAEGAGACIL